MTTSNDSVRYPEARLVNPGSGFPSLRVLALGNDVFSHDWQIDWVASLGSQNGRGGLEEIYLLSCCRPRFYNPLHLLTLHNKSRKRCWGRQIRRQVPPFLAVVTQMDQQPGCGWNVTADDSVKMSATAAAAATATAGDCHITLVHREGTYGPTGGPPSLEKWRRQVPTLPPMGLGALTPHWLIGCGLIGVLLIDWGGGGLERGKGVPSEEED